MSNSVLLKHHRTLDYFIIIITWIMILDYYLLLYKIVLVLYYPRGMLKSLIKIVDLFIEL